MQQSLTHARTLRWLGVEADEATALAWSFVYFFSLLSGYYVLRPVRDALMTSEGTRLIPIVFSSVFVCMLLLVPIYGAIVSRFPRRTFLPIIFGAVILGLAGFYAAFQAQVSPRITAVAFAVFLSVFNLFAVSVFWSFMSDIFTNAQAKRLYGVIAAGGTMGAIAGPLLTSLLARELGVAKLLLVSGGMFGVCLVCIFRLIPWAHAQEARLHREDGERPIGGSIVAGATRVFRSKFLFALVLHMIFGLSVGTLLYNQQAAVTFARLADVAGRTEFFANIDLAVNVMVIIVQLLLTRQLLTRFGVAPLLVIPAGLAVVGLAILSVFHTVLLLAAVQVVTRAATFAFTQPARESLFTRVDRESRYKAKNFIDTFIYRGSDVLTSWSYYGLASLGLGLSALSGIWAIVAVCFLGAALWIVRIERTLPGEAPAVSLNLRAPT